MRLNSYNMAVKALRANGCYADMVDRMWTYMEEGDSEKADCARQKALMLLGLIKTIRRWQPSIGAGAKKLVGTSTVASGSFVFPYIFESAAVNGVVVNTNRTILFSGTNGTVLKDAYSKKPNLVYVNDDMIRFSASYNSGILSTELIYIPSLSPITGRQYSESSSVTMSYTSDGEETINDQPLCLTNEQILSVIRKIDELCDNCNC